MYVIAIFKVLFPTFFFFMIYLLLYGQVPHWLDKTKKILKQVDIGPPYTFHFRVKFYSSEPNLLQEELTR